MSKSTNLSLSILMTVLTCYVTFASPAAGQGGCLNCYYSYLTNKHLACEELTLLWGYDGPEHCDYARIGHCSSEHHLIQDCQPPRFVAGNREIVFAASTTIDTDVAVELVERYPAFAAISHDGGSLEVYSCTGSVVRRLPISPELGASANPSGSGHQVNEGVSGIAAAPPHG